jgi:hypothetical protein
MNEAKDRYPNKHDSGRQNALRHALWQYYLACMFGSDRAQQIGDIHESISTDPCDTAIDQFNNEAARAWAMSHCSFHSAVLYGDFLVDEIIRKMDAGDFITSPTDPRVVPPCP